jgi:hypothetical protein
MRRAELEACERRKLELSAAASFHLTPDQTELQLENKARNHHVIERAQELKDEQMPEVKQGSQMHCNLPKLTNLIT